ncbi:MAG: insulinase family protein [Candidatus Eisenbacteria bacterium]|nr:insulinase family protein [Candidatus Eisenbacteria bacterium]
MRHLGFLLLFACAAAAAPGPASGADTGARPAASGPAEARLVTLKNGMRLLLAPDSTAAAVDLAVWVDAGPVHERAGATGVAHLFEHMMFRGSAHVAAQEHSRLIQAEGGTANATTTPDLACYYQTLPRAALELAFRLEGDRLASLELSPENLEAERSVVRDEKRWRAENSPVGRALQQLYAVAYTRHPYRWPVIGLDEDLARVTLEDCRQFFRGHYAPDNALVTVVGDFDAGEALGYAKRWLEPVPRRRVDATPVPAEPPQTAERRATARMEVPVRLLVLGWKAPGHADPDGPALQLLARIAFNGPSSRLNRALVSGGKQSCLLVQGGLDGRKDAQLLYAVAALRPGADSARVERDLVGEVEKLAGEPVSDEELDRARRQEEIGTLFSWQTARGRAEALGTAQLVDGDWRAAGERLERLRRLTPADLQRAAGRVLQAAGRSVVWALPANAVAQGGAR